MARNKETKLTVDVPEELSASERAEVAEKVIAFIQNRTKHGWNVYGRDWPGRAGEYSASYAKAKGVSTDGPVDLSDSHDMLDGIQYFPGLSPPGQITVGYKSGSKLERKAEGNILGTYGRDSPIQGKARPFLDILQKDLRKIIAEVEDDRDS